MALEMFLKLDGVTGGSRNYNYKGWSEVSAWHWEMTSGRGAGRPDAGHETAFGEMSLVKKVGMDTPALMTLYAQGSRIASADLDIVPVLTKKEARQKYLAVRLEDVRIKSLLCGGTAAEDAFEETLTLVFARVRFEYSVNAVPGTDRPGADYAFRWDLERGEALDAPAND